MASTAPSSPALSPSSSPSPTPSQLRPPGMDICSVLDCISIFVPILLGVLLSTMGLGMVLVSSCHYCSVFPDSRFAKKRLGVVLVAFLQVVQTSMDLVRVLLIFAAHFGDFAFFLQPRWEDSLAPLFAVVIQLHTQFFLLSRAYSYATVARMSKRMRLGGMVAMGALIITSGALGCVTSLEIKLLDSLAKLSPGSAAAPLLNVTAPAWLTTSAFIDSTLCIIVTHELFSARRAANGLSSFNSQRTRDVMARLVKVVLRSGFVLALAQTATAMVWIAEAHTSHGALTSSWVYLPIIVIPKLYTLTFLAILAAPRRHSHSSFGSSTIGGPYNTGEAGQRSGVALPGLTESRRRLFPPVIDKTLLLSNNTPPSHGEPSVQHVDHPYSQTYSYPTRPAAPTPTAAHGRLPPPIRTTSYEDDEARLMEEDSPVSPSIREGVHEGIFSQTSRREEPSTFASHRNPLVLAPYAYGAFGRRASTDIPRPSYRGGAHESRVTDDTASFPLSSIRADHLPPSPPLTPRHLPPSQEDLAAPEAFAYAPSSPLPFSFPNSVSPPPPAALDLSSSSSPVFFRKPSKTRMLLPHPPLSTVEEGSTPSRSARVTGEWVVPESGGESWVALRPDQEVRFEGGGREEGQEKLVSPLVPESTNFPSSQFPSSHPYAFPPSPVTPTHPYAAQQLSHGAASPRHDTKYSPPTSPRWTERRGAVDLLPAVPGRRGLTMEPLSDEEIGRPLPRRATRGRGETRRGFVGAEEELKKLEKEVDEFLEQGAGGSEAVEEVYKEAGNIGGGDEASNHPPSHFSTSSSSASLRTLPHHRHRHPSKPSHSFPFPAHNSGSDTTLDHVLHALRTPLPPRPSHSRLDSDADSDPNNVTAVKQHRRRFPPSLAKHARKFSASLSVSGGGGEKTRMISRDSSGSTFVCKDAKAFEKTKEESGSGDGSSSGVEAGISAW